MNQVFSWICGFAVVALSMYLFHLPVIVAAILGTIGMYVLPRLLLQLGMKGSRALIERSPEGRAIMAAHDAEQAMAWQQWEELKRVRASGKEVDPAEVERLEGILFRNKGIIGSQVASEAIPASGPARPPTFEEQALAAQVPKRIQKQPEFSSKEEEAMFERMKAIADEAMAMDPMVVAQDARRDVMEIQSRDLSSGPDLRVDEARFLVTYVCWTPDRGDAPEVTAVYREVRQRARDVVQRWKRAGGRIVADNRMFDLLKANMSEAERAEHQALAGQDCAQVMKGMLAAADLASLPTASLEKDT